MAAIFLAQFQREPARPLRVDLGNRLGSRSAGGKRANLAGRGARAARVFGMQIGLIILAAVPARRPACLPAAQSG